MSSFQERIDAGRIRTLRVELQHIEHDNESRGAKYVRHRL